LSGSRNLLCSHQFILRMRKGYLRPRV